MKTEKSLVNLYQTFFPSRELENEEASLRQSIVRVKETGIDTLDEQVLGLYKKDPSFIEKQILQCIMDLNQINVDIDYLSRYAQQLNATSIIGETDKLLFVDELMEYTMLSFFITIYSLENNKSKENFERCFKNCFVLLDLQGEKHTIGSHNIQELEKMSRLPMHLMNLATDTYWTAWTFLIGHELFHLTNETEMPAYEEEMKADAYGYSVLIQMILAQKENKIPEEIQVFHEYMYLSPIMLLEYYRLRDFYRELCGKEIQYEDHPKPEERQDHLFELFDTYVPDDMNTEEGNALLNIFLDNIDILREQLRVKKKLGKLELRD